MPVFFAAAVGRSLATALLCLHISAAFCPAQATDAVASRLAGARTLYESRLESTRAKVLASIDTKERELRASKPPNLAAIEAIQNARRTFVSTGNWPDLTRTPSLRQEAATAAASMKHAFEKAMADYVRAEQDEAAGMIEEDLRVFSLHSDIVPWGPNLIGVMQSDWASIRHEARTLDLRVPRGVEYRIEILGRRTAGPGDLELTVPLPSGNVLPLVALLSPDGDFRVLLTIGEGAASADLGVARPINIDASTPGEHFSARTREASFEVRSVRVKPLVAGEPEALPSKPSTDGTSNPQPDKQARSIDQWLPLKGVWRGNNHTRDDKSALSCVVKISRSGDVLVLHADHGDHTLAFDCRLVGERLTLTGVRQTKGPKALRRSPAGSGRVTATGIELKYRWYLDTSDVKNQLVEGTLSVRRDEK